jgi:hypothetical protein
MAIDFSRILGPAPSAPGNFERLCVHLVRLEFPDVRAVDGNGGDQGVDAFISDSLGPAVQAVFQFKFFTGALNSSRKKHIERSLATAVANHHPKKWVLCIPKTFTPSEHRWWESLVRSHRDVVIELWDEIKLTWGVVEHPELRDEFFPERFSRTQERQLKDIFWESRFLGVRFWQAIRHWRWPAGLVLATSALALLLVWFLSDTYQIRRILADAPVGELAQTDAFGSVVGRWSAALLLYGDSARSDDALKAVRGSAKPVTFARLAAAAEEIGHVGEANRFTQAALRATSELGDEESRLASLSQISVFLAIAGQTDRAGNLARGVIADVNALPPSSWGGGHGRYGLPSVRFDTVAGAIETLEIVGDVDAARTEAASYLGLDAAGANRDEFMAMGKPHRIFLARHQTGSPYYVSWIHGQTAQMFAELGYFDAAVEEAKGIEYVPFRQSTMYDISAALADHGQIEKAVSLQGQGVEPRLAIAVALARTGRLAQGVRRWKEAYATIRAITNASGRDFLLSKAAMALAQMDRLRWARTIANECSSPEMRLDAYTVILAEYTKKKEALRSAVEAIVLSEHLTPASP